MVEITTSVGRIVWGHPTKSKNKTRKNPATNAKEVVMKDGVPVQQWAFGVAFPKAEFHAHVWPAMAAEAAALYPTGTPPQKFAYKYVDGDGVDDQGKPYSAREGYAGCYVLSVSTELMAPGVFKLNGAQYQQMDANAIKCGDYVALGLNIKGNIPVDRSQTPGLYINPLAIEFVGYGTEIQGQGQADPMALFAGRQHQLPAGASAAPVGGGGAVGMPGMGAAPPAPGAMPGAPGMMPPAAPMAPAPIAPPAPPPPAPVATGPIRPTDPAWIMPNPAGGEMWWNGTGWAPAPVLPPPAHDFVQNAGMPPAPPTMPAAPGMPGMMPPR